MPLNNILLYTDDNIIGQSIHDYLSDIHQDITQASYQDIVQGGVAPLAETVLFNMIHKDISAADTVVLLNKLRFHFSRCTLLVLMVKSDIANLCRELIDLENLLILTEKSSLDAFSAITRTQDETPQTRYLRTQRKLTARELQVLELIIACNNNKRIASLLNIDHKTVHSHRIHIMKKLGMNSSQVMHKQIVNMNHC